MNRYLASSLLASALVWFCAPATGCSSGADVAIVSVTELGVMPKPAGIDGRDGGTSGRFQGRSVWVYGDTVTTEKGAYPSTWRNNTMSWTDDLDASDGIDGFVQPADSAGAPRELFPRTAEEQAFNQAHIDLGDGSCSDPCGARYAIWGSGPVEDPSRGRALLAYGKVYSEPGDFNFYLVGTSIAVWEDFDAGPTRPDVSSTLDDPTLLFDAASEGEFAIPALFGDDLYLFSCSGGPAHSSGCKLARAPLDDLFDRQAWTFRTADGWSSAIDEAVELFDGSPNLSVHWNAHVGRWLAVYMTSGHIAMRTATELEGPWSGESTVFEPTEANPIHALAHAEYQEDGGRVEYLSYLADEFRLLRVELGPR